ncbi:MAG TPA: MarR family transcriptional regulator [Candidatus Nitrosopolaris sp.]|nr:MarR family transcriptional regulator [Candidatus Nitrosopolaris sp.]
MSANDSLDESPNHFMVLDSITRGITNVEKISRTTKLHNNEVESIVSDLLTQRLIVKSERKGFIFGKKKVEVCITEIGSKLLNAKKQELEQKRQQMRQSYDSGDGTQLQSYMDVNRMWIPMMLFSGIMDIVFFTSMMSFMGLGVNPMESAILGSNSGHHDAGASADGTLTVHDQSATSGDDGNTSEGPGHDNSGFDSGGFDGFDSDGGFDSF